MKKLFLLLFFVCCLSADEFHVLPSRNTRVKMATAVNDPSTAFMQGALFGAYLARNNTNVTADEVTSQAYAVWSGLYKISK